MSTKNPERAIKPIRGAFVSIEGIEGAGKSSLLPTIAGCLNQHQLPFVTTREPGGTAFAETIRNLVLGINKTQQNADDEAPTAKTEALLMFASRSQHLDMLIRPALANGQWVVCDRFTDSTLAYQGGARALGADQIYALADWVHKDVWPDMTLLFDVSVATGTQRIKGRDFKDRMEQERQSFFEEVRASYLELAKVHSDRIKVINAEVSLTEVQEQVEQVMKEFIATWSGQ